jgi:tripartite-type tricarboxylate transporter receptor subunit TctC
MLPNRNEDLAWVKKPRVVNITWEDNMNHTISLKTLTLAATLGVSGIAVSAAECPAGFPSGPINFVVGFGAGGGTDAIARGVASAIEQQQGWTVVVDNKPGAGGGVTAALVKEKDPDGYAIGVVGSDTIALLPHTSPDVTYSWSDFDYLGTGMQINFGMVTRADSPFSTLEEFVEYAREKGRATISVGGVNQEVLVKQLSDHFGVNFIAVPGNGAADALQSALGGHVDATTQGTRHVQQVLSGNMKQVSTLIDKRVDLSPDTKTLVESGMDESASILGYTIFIMPKDVDSGIQTCLAGVLDEALNSESYGELMANFNNKPANLGPEGLAALVERSSTNYEKIFGDK